MSNATKKKPTGWFRLKAGIAIIRDLEDKPDPETGLYPEKQISAGSIFESEEDMVKKHGGEKYERVATPRRARDGSVDATSPAAYDADGNPLTGDFGSEKNEAPHGQVSQGFQQTGGAFSKEKPAGIVLAPDSLATVGGAMEAQKQIDDAERDRTANPQVQGDDQPDFGQMTVAQLDQYAADNEIDLSRAHTKADKVKAVRRAMDKKAK